MDNSPTQPGQDPSNNIDQALATEINTANSQLPNTPPSKPPKKRWIIWLGLVFIIVIVICGLFLILQDHPKKNQQASSNQCIDKTFSTGSSGSCVLDIQSMINFLETDSLNECAFTGAQTLPVTGQYNGITKQQVLVVQKWVNCYNKQEGAPTNITANGIVNGSTWSNICTYAYVYPKQAGQSNSPYYRASITAGKNAGC